MASRDPKLSSPHSHHGTVPLCLPPSQLQPISCRTWLSLLETGGRSTACGWTDLGGGRTQRVQGRGGGGGNSPPNPPCCAPRKRGSWKQLPHKPPPCPRTYGGWSCGKFPPLRRVPQFWEGTNRGIRMDQDGQPLPRSPKCRPYFPNRKGDLDTGKVHPRSVLFLFWGAAGGAPSRLGKGLDIVGERDGHRVLGDGPDGTWVQ